MLMFIVSTKGWRVMQFLPELTTKQTLALITLKGYSLLIGGTFDSCFDASSCSKFFISFSAF